MSCDLPGAWGLALDATGLCLLWGAVLLRALPALRHPHQRGLWLAVASAAVAMTLHLEPVCQYVTQLTGSARSVAIAKNQAGVVSAGAVLHFAAYATSGRRHTGTIVLTTAAMMAALLALAGLGAVPPGSHGPPFTLARAPSAAYWLLLVTLHVVANAACVRVCWAYGRRGPHRSLNLGLMLFGWGTALAGLFWIGTLVLLVVDSRPGTTLCLLLSGHAVLRAAALLVPTMLELRRALGHAHTIWRIWPLWRHLVDAVPHVALSVSRSRLLAFLQPQVSWRLIAYRKVIEIRDAILALGHYADPAVSDDARAHVRRCGVPAERTDAFVTACLLTRARAAKLGGARPDPTREVVTAGRHTTDLATETRFLLQLAEAYTSPCVREFAADAETARASAGGPR
ncbi:MAB_1171c family putative transporter [Streptomyces coeruleoprunus]|uniref:MAB_1171c family putative transporter n=1 Tax=Streptomyces coeruleoprunus TaxID=285563 RepID=A0ABV9X7G8_9ACTN